MKKFGSRIIAIGCVFAICLLLALGFDAQSSQAVNQGRSPELSQVEQEYSLTSVPRQLPTGDFRLRSYLKESHPKFRARSSLAPTTTRSSNCDPVISGRIHRFIAGVDSCVTPMTEQEINQKLNDPFATAILRQGQFPDSVDALNTAVANSGLGLQRQSYMVGEGSQIPTSVASREEPRNLRYAITWGLNQNDAQILLSATPGGNSSFHQVISWDKQARKYNFYEFREQRGTTEGTTTKVWSWAGDSPLARTTGAMGKGCFDCHHNGMVIMKELQFPWNNWQSQLATISPLVVPFAVAQEELFKQLNGAQVFENVIRNGFQTYYRNWLRDRYNSDTGTIRLSDVNEMLRHLTTNTTINFASTQIQSNGANTSPANADISGIPNDLFLWDSVLDTVLKLDYTVPPLTFQRGNYDDYLKNHNFKLVQSDFTKPDGTPLYDQKGSTYFSLFVPVPPAEDLFMLQQMRSNNILTDKFIAALLMVDFKNPVFSDKRSGLQKYAAQIASGSIVNRVSSVPNDFAEKVRAAAASQPPCDSAKLDNCTAEQEFLYTWDLPDDQWKVSVEKRIQAYLDNIKNLSPEDQLDQLMRLSVKRQAQFKSWSLIGNLNEFSLLIPYTDLSQQ